MVSKVVIKKTGHQDIDTLLEKTHVLLKEGERLKKDISVSLEFKPVSPHASRRAHLRRYRMFRSKIES